MEEMTETEKNYQLEEEKYVLQKVYISQLNKEEESITRSYYSGYSYFG